MAQDQREFYVEVNHGKHSLVKETLEGGCSLRRMTDTPRLVLLFLDRNVLEWTRDLIQIGECQVKNILLLVSKIYFSYFHESNSLLGLDHEDSPW